MQVSIVDVFAERPLEGNQLAVVRGASALSTAQMQALAREMNFSETTFVTAEAAGRATVRIFTPASELPFAGHPTLGTAWVLSDGAGKYVLDLPIGSVGVECEDEIIWFTSPQVTLGQETTRRAAADLLRLSEDQVSKNFPVRFAEVGPRFLLVGLVDRSALRAASVDPDVFHKMFGGTGGVPSVYAFTADAHSEVGDFASRVFFFAGSIREDPATGSANAAFAAYLHEFRGSASPLEVTIDQGVEMLRPSRLYLRADGGGEGRMIRVGGRVQPVLSGALVPSVLEVLG